MDRSQVEKAESLRMERIIHGDQDHDDVAETLNGLGAVCHAEGNNTGARQYFEESLRMKRAAVQWKPSICSTFVAPA